MKFSELIQKLDAARLISHTSLLDTPDIELSDTAPDTDPEITAVAAVEQAPTGTLAYIEGAKFASFVKTTRASALILPLDEVLQHQATERGIAWLSTSNPRLLFAKAIALFYQPFHPAPEIHATAVIHPSATVGQNVAIGAHVVIQAEVTIGDGVCIHPNVVIYPMVQIGDRTLLHANCVIHERVQIGADCVIHSGAAIGAEGFGFVPILEGWQKIEQSGYVVLEDGVEVGCNSAIDRPAVGETRIGRNTKLDNMVHIAHGCLVGENCAMAAQVGLAGGVIVGKRVILGGQVGVANNVNIGDSTQAGSRAAIHSNVKPGSVVMGNPAIPYNIFIKAAAIYQRLPEMYQFFKRLKRLFPDLSKEE